MNVINMTPTVTRHAFAMSDDTTLEVRVVELDGNPWFVASDVCRALGMDVTNGTKQWLSSTRPYERRPVDASLFAPEIKSGAKGRGGLRPGTPLTALSESGLYKLVLRSDKPEARSFQDWVTEVVLPAIRKDGAYVVGEEKLATGELDEDAFVERALVMLRAKIERVAKERDAARTQVVTLAPKAALVDEHFARLDWVPVVKFVRSLDGINSTMAKKDLGRLGYLWRPQNGTWRVRSQFRDVLFREKRNEGSGQMDIYLTPKGCERVTAHHRAGEMTLKLAA